MKVSQGDETRDDATRAALGAIRLVEPGYRRGAATGGAGAGRWGVTKTLRITSCWDCKYHWNIGVGDVYMCCFSKPINRRIEDMATIPSWCPLEDAPEAVLAGDIDQDREDRRGERRS